MSAAITIESRGRRHYLRGNTYPIKDQLRSAGAKWDADARCWWTGKRELAEKLATSAPTSSPSDERPSERLNPDSEIRGKAQYKGRQYLLVWAGETRRGPACKLAFRDGSKVFWADASEVQIVKRYRAPIAFGKLERLREEYSQARKEGLEHPRGRRYECEECGEWVTSGDGSSCWETGLAH